MFYRKYLFNISNALDTGDRMLKNTINKPQKAFLDYSDQSQLLSS